MEFNWPKSVQQSVTHTEGVINTEDKIYVSTDENWIGE